MSDNRLQDEQERAALLEWTPSPDAEISEERRETLDAASVDARFRAARAAALRDEAQWVEDDD